MELKAIDRIQKSVYRDLEQMRINDAFADVAQLTSELCLPELKDEVDQVKMSYDFMLQYLSRGILDPQRDQVLQRIVDSLYSITDRATIAAKENVSSDVFYARRRELGNIQLSELVDTWKSTLHKHSLLKSIPAEQQNASAIQALLRENERNETNVFNKIWSTLPLTRDDAALVKNLLDDADLPLHAKCLFLSALFLGLMTFYDEAKTEIIAQTYTNSNIPELQIRALLYTVVSLYIYGKRAEASVAVSNAVNAMTDNPSFTQDMASIQFLLSRSRNTDNITRRVREDLMPGLMNMSPDLIRKIKDKNNPIDISDIEANPEWQDMLENSGVSKKMEEFNEMQQAGNDVFISAFSHLKSFPFFSTLSNWFLPYHTGHSVLNDTLGAAALGDIIGEAPLCNSDKYSFCLSMGSIPESQRQMMINQVQSQYSELKELKSAEIPDTSKTRESIANMHLQDLYRFFKLFSRRREFIPIFEKDMDLTGIGLLEKYTCDISSVSIIAEFYLKNEFYDDALKYYNLILETSSAVDPIVFQKIGFLQQNLGNNREALKYYRKYLLAHDNDIWTLKHMAACYRSLKRPDKAMDCYKVIDELQPNSVATTLNIGNCLLEMGNTNDALQYYYKADFLNGAKHRAWRPIAWCSFITGNDERALNYYDKIINEDTPTAQDYLNRAHVLLCTKRITEAISNYKKSLEIEGNAHSFREAFFNDAKHLSQRGITNNDMALIIDVLSIKG